MQLRKHRARLRALWHWKRQESDLDEEIRFHLGEDVEEGVRAGLSAGAARARAMRDFGNVTLIREMTREIRDGDRRNGWCRICVAAGGR